MKPYCCWCGSHFVKIDAHYWCTTESCRTKQHAHSIGVSSGQGKSYQHKYLYVPLPRQVEFDACLARNLLGGGAAGSTKSHAARYSLYRRALKHRDYEALLLRRIWDELEKHHLRLMDRESKIFREYGLNVDFSITRREMRFHDTGAVLEGGHMEDPDDVERYLSRERDDIVVDEGSTFHPRPLLELSTRARSSKEHINADGGARFRVFTNPGGPASSTLKDFFIDHSPNWEDFPAALQEMYDPSEWAYIPGRLEDNPYLPAHYERDLAILTPWRYQQLRHNDWDIVAGQFFNTFSATTHVKDLDSGGKFHADNYEWFRSLDWGYSSPGCVLWWCCLPDGNLYIRRDHKYSHALVGQLIDTVDEITEDLGIHRIRYTAADPALWGPSVTADALEGENMNETFARQGMPLIKSKNERVNGWQRVRELLGNPDGPEDIRTPARLIIHPDCRYLIRSLTNAVSDPRNPEDVDTDIDDHALDTLRYGAMSRPSPTRSKNKTRRGTFQDAAARAREFQKQMTSRSRPLARY